jgi:hypothetical protein
MNDELFFLTPDVLDTLQLEETDRQDIQYLQSMSTGYTIMLRAHPTETDAMGFPKLMPAAVPKLGAEQLFRLMRIRSQLLQSITSRNAEARWCQCAMRYTEMRATIRACQDAWERQVTFGECDHVMSKTEMESHVEKLENTMRQAFRKEEPRRFATSLSEPNCLNCDCPRQIKPETAFGDESVWRNVLNVLGCQGMVLSNSAAEIARFGNELYNLRMAAPSQKKIVEEFAEIVGVARIVKKILGFLDSFLTQLFNTDTTTLTAKLMGTEQPSASAKNNSAPISPTPSATGDASLTTSSKEDSAPPIFSNDLQPQISGTPSEQSPQTETND